MPNNKKAQGYRPYSLISTSMVTPTPADSASTPAPLKPIPLQSFSEVKDNMMTSVSLDERSSSASKGEGQENAKDPLRHGLTCNLLWTSFVVLMGTSFQFGYNLGVLNQPVYLIRQFYNTTYTTRHGYVSDQHLTALWSLTTTLYLPGGMVGAFLAGYIADRFGRKRAVQIGTIPGIIGAVVSYSCVLVNMPEMLMVGRIVTGFSCGIATQLAPMYLAEIAPYNLRGALGTANQLFITIGILAGSVLGLEEILGTVERWQYLLLASAIPAVLCLLLLACLPDSPRYLLINRHRRDQAEKALQYLRGSRDVSADMEEMEAENRETGGQSGTQGAGDFPPGAGENSAKRREVEGRKREGYSMCRLLGSQELRLPLIITVMLQITQQLSGINAIVFYSKGIYLRAGLASEIIPYSVVLTNGVNVIMTIIAVPIMDRVGRRPLLVYPMIVMIFILGIIVCSIKLQFVVWWSCYVSVACVLAYVICFSLGLGPIPMMIGAELFRQGPRPRALSLAGFTNWLFTAIIAFSFEPVQELLHEYTFLIFLSCMIIFTLFVYHQVPETKNRTFEEIAAHFQTDGHQEGDETADEVFGGSGGRLALLKDQAGPHAETLKTLNSDHQNNNWTLKKQATPEKLSMPTGYVPYIPNPDIKLLCSAPMTPFSTKPSSVPANPPTSLSPILEPKERRGDEGSTGFYRVASPVSPTSLSPILEPREKVGKPQGDEGARGYYRVAGPAVDECVEAVVVEEDGMWSVRL